MSRFNVKTQGTKTVNRAGGEAYKQSPKLELVSILLTSFVKDQFYSKVDKTFDRLKDLVSKVDPMFAAKAGVYARHEFGMRSISHVLASELSKRISGLEWSKRFYEKVVRRVDDITEILSYHFSQGHKMSSAMKKGLAKSFDKFDHYQLSKYKGANKQIKLVDAVNMLHPVETEKNAQALKELIAGKLINVNTWESKLTTAGQKAETDEQKHELKQKAWADLLNERKIGYFALLRNLRNILEQAPDMIDKACELLVDENLIRKSLVLPFRYVTAINEIQQLSQDQVRKVMVAINKAVDISCKNVPVFEGKTLVVSDFSGSMGASLTSNKGKASLFGAVLAKANNADFMIFGDNALYVNYNPMDSTLSIVNYMMSHNHGWYGSFGYVGHGTNFHAIFQTANKAYDRIVIFSDMQGWVSGNTPSSSFNEYKSAMNANPYIYSVDLNSYGDMQFPESNCFALAGFSEKIFDLMKALEQDPNVLLEKIEAVKI